MQNGTHKSSTLGRAWSRLWNSPLPTMGCEIAHEGVGIARWSRNSSGLETGAWRPIPAGAVEASPLRENIQQPEEVRKAFGETLGSMGISTASNEKRPTDVVLIIPDQAARLFVLNFDTFPQGRTEGLPLVKWRLKKSVPFDIDAAAISYFVQRSGAERQVVAVATPQWIVRQYETVAESFGLRPKWVTLSTLASLGLVNGFAGSDSSLTGSNGASDSDANTDSKNEPGILVAK